MKKALLLLASLCASTVPIFSQTGQAVNQVAGPTINNGVYQYFYNGSNQVTYICFANAQVAPTVYLIGGTPSMTQIAVASNVATVTFGATAQLWLGQLVTVSNSGTAALNGTYSITGVSGSTATFTTSGVSDATYSVTGTGLTTTGPVLNASVWNITAFKYVSGNLASSYSVGGGVTPSLQYACSNRANY